MSSESNRIASHGRGGAGNLGKENPTLKTQPNDLITPTLKGEHYTTGRGGSGNMARNDPNNPDLARASQDVDAPHHREPEGPHHYGRGGAANVITPSAQDTQKVVENNQRKSGEAKRAEGAAGDTKGLIGKGKEFLKGLGGAQKK